MKPTPLPNVLDVQDVRWFLTQWAHERIYDEAADGMENVSASD